MTKQYNRDEFSPKVKQILRDRVGSLCSNPDCQTPTTGPEEDPEKALYLGTAAHITAAAPGGPRYDETLTEEERCGIDNGIWLCDKCSKLIDRNVNSHPTSLLKEWKKAAELKAEDELIGGKSKRKENVLHALWKGSQLYHDALRGPNGRFHFLDISRIILTSFTGDTWFNIPVTINPTNAANLPEEDDENKSSVNNGSNENNIIQALPLLWKNKIKHTLIVGEGGMGKTVSLIHLWENFLKDTHSSPIPIYIALNELNQVKEDKREGFILRFICENYTLNAIPKEELETFLRTPRQDGDEYIPSVVLLLDGFNEITVERKELLIELNRLSEQYPGIQFVMTSRLDMRSNYNWLHWNLAKLQELDETKITAYLLEKGMCVPKGERFITLLKNPMMLTLYATMCDIQARYTGSLYCDFKENVETTGELLWNFMEAQVANLLNRLGQDIAQVHYYKFLLKHFLPALGFEMEKAKLFNFTLEQMSFHIEEKCMHFAQSDFFNTFSEFKRYAKKLPLGKCENEFDQFEKTENLIGILCDELHMVVREGNTYRFLHQNFRDFFAGVHILNEIEVGIKKKIIPVVLKERVLDVYVRRYIGEIEGEHEAKPYIDEQEKRWRSDIKENKLSRVLELCRGVFDGSIGYAVWNICTIWKELRGEWVGGELIGELSGADLSRLDLTGLQLNGVRCSRLYGKRYLSANFSGTRIHESDVLHKGHTDSITSAVYSWDGKKILSTSWDNTIKEWDVETGECIHTWLGHSKEVNSAAYSPDGKKILSASWDKTIKEWDVETGKCLMTFIGHQNRVNSVIYSQNGKKILSASWDHTIKEWDTERGKCVRTLTGHRNEVNSAVYSPDGKKILSASWDKTIKVWDVEEGKCIHTYVGHRDGVVSAVYSPDGKKILSASWDHTIKEWDTERGKCVQTLTGHRNEVNSAVYSPDGKKILSASVDETIKEWNVETGQCIRTWIGHKDWVNSIIYSPDGKKILSASNDDTIKEWNLESGKCVHTLMGFNWKVTNTVSSPNGKKILSASSDHTIKEWSLEKGECVATFTGHSKPLTSAAYSQDGKKILSASADKTIKEWNVETGQCVHTWIGHRDGVNSAVYSPNGKKVISASWDNTIKEWNVEADECVHTYVGHRDGVKYAVYTADGKKIFSISSDAIIKEWDVETGECLRTFTRNDPSIPWNQYEKLDIKVKTDYNKIFFSDASGKKMELENVPGLFIQGCTFQELEKGSIWTEKGLNIMKQYGATISIKK